MREQLASTLLLVKVGTMDDSRHSCRRGQRLTLFVLHQHKNYKSLTNNKLQNPSKAAPHSCTTPTTITKHLLDKPPTCLGDPRIHQPLAL
ncbi:hypothetical protein E4U55_006937 [Claviceps digitariae]|nr:hypothetical protein E4U55_006937 [Claviceps digitariae]